MRNFILAASFMLFTTVLMAAGPSQQWRLDISSAEEGNVEVAEIELMEAEGGVSVVELFRNYTFEEDSPAGSASWSIPHNLGTKLSTTTVQVIAYAVDVVPPGTWFYNTTTLELSQRGAISYEVVEFVTGATGEEPAIPEVGDVFYNTDTTNFSRWEVVWTELTVTTVAGALPEPTAVEPTTTVLVPGTGLPTTGGPAANNTVELTFPQAVAGAAAIRGATFDMPSTNRPVDAIPVIEGFENRNSAAAFDGNKGSWVKSKRAPSERSPLTLQYTYWVGDSSRYPNIVEYSITAKNQSSAPRSWKLMMYKDGQWVTVDQQAAIRFEDGQTRVFSID